MTRLTRNLSIVWRMEQLIARRRFAVLRKQAGAFALAGLVALFGLVLLDMAAFFALAPLIGQAYAALAIAGVNFLLAVLLAVWASGLSADKEISVAVEVRDLALTDLEAEAEAAVEDARALAADVRKVARDPLAALLPGLNSSVIAAILRSLRSYVDKPSKKP
ncbi:MAG: phage holin family protein [Kiloniellales bacterium]